MTITIGRVGTDGILLADPEISYSGNQVTLSAVYTPAAGSTTAVADTLWLKEQLLGLTGNDDEPIVPVAWSGRPELDGYYRVTDTHAALPTGSTKDSEPYLEWGATLERLKDYRQPRMEIFGVYGRLTNSLGFTSPNLVTAVPQLAIDWWPDIAGTYITRVADLGTLQAMVQSTPISSTYLSRLSIAAPYGYIGACGAEYDLNGAPTWRKVIGRRAFTTAEVSTGNAVRISNGLVRVRPTATTLQVEWYNGSTWSAVTSFQLWGAAAFSFVSARILQTSPVEMVLRLGAIMGGATQQYTVDLRLRRGLRTVFGRIGAMLTGNYSIRFSPGVTATSLTGGLRRTSNNASGNREILISDTATTKDTSTGTLTDPTLRTSMLFGISVELGGSAATGWDTASNQIQEWFMSASETQRVVAG